MQLVNHGADAALLARMTAAMHAFFDLPLEDKLKVGAASHIVDCKALGSPVHPSALPAAQAGRPAAACCRPLLPGSIARHAAALNLVLVKLVPPAWQEAPAAASSCRMAACNCVLFRQALAPPFLAPAAWGSNRQVRRTQDNAMGYSNDELTKQTRDLKEVGSMGWRERWRSSRQAAERLLVEQDPKPADGLLRRPA